MHRLASVALLTLPLAAPALAASSATPRTAHAAPAPKGTPPARPTAKRTPAVPLSFRDFFEPTPRELKPSAKLLSLNGKRVRIVGFMAHMTSDHDEHAGQPVPGAFHLCPRPTQIAEGGAGTGDLPASSVLVILPGGPNRTLPFTPRALEVVGRLELGPRTESNGQVSSLRIFLDPPPARASAPAHGAARAPSGTRRAKRASWRAPK